MRKKWYWVMLILCVTTFMAAAASYYFKNILGKNQTSEVVKAEQPKEQQSPKNTVQVQKNSKATETTDEKTDSEEVSSEKTEEPPVEEGDNGDIFKDNGYPYMIKVNRQMNVVTIYTLDEEGCYTVPYKAMVCSVGLNNKTPRGTFKIQKDRYEWRELVGQVYGQYAVRIKGSIMFHSVPYYTPQKDKLESEEFNKLGGPASKGCVRLSVEDAKWIYDNCEKGTIVQIFDSDYAGPLGKPEPIHMDLTDSRCGYDPTDDFDGNPWFMEGAGDTQQHSALSVERTSTEQTEEEITDYDAPVITLLKNAPEKITPAQAEDEEYMMSLVKVTDESDIAEFNVSLPLWVSTKTAYRVVYTARDAHGNTATAYYAFQVESE